MQKTLKIDIHDDILLVSAAEAEHGHIGSIFGAKGMIITILFYLEI